MSRLDHTFYRSFWLAAGLGLALGVLPGRAAATAYYVTPTGTLANSGTSWATAWSNVQTAVRTATNAGDEIYLRWGVYSNAGQVAILNAGGVTIVNCTFAHNVGWGVARLTSAGLTVKNSIFWGNALGGIGHNANLELSYTDAQDFWAPAMGVGNSSADPLFVNPAAGDYHLQSPAGSWHGGAWEDDARLSPCIDAGDPASEWRQEAKPSGGRVNLGAYGNTAQSSRSLRGTVFRAR